MLYTLNNEWIQANQHQVILEQVKSEDGSKVLYQKSMVTYRGANLELSLSAVNDSIGIDVGRSDSFTIKLIALNTNRIVAIDPQLKGMSSTDIQCAILDAIDPDSKKYKEFAYQRNRKYRNSMWNDVLDSWKNTLVAVGYPEEDIINIMNYCTNEMKTVKYIRGKCETFINVLAKYKNEILSTEPCKEFEGKTERDVFYDEIALYIAKKFTVTTDSGSTFDNLPKNYVLDHLLKEDYDNRLPPAVMRIKNILRDVYQMCGEKNPNFCYILVSLGAYFEKVTRESPAFRYAAILGRKENDRKKTTFKKSFQERYSGDKAGDKAVNQNTKERPNKPFKNNKPKTNKPKTTQTSIPMNLNPIGENMFEQALANAQPLKSK